MLAVPATRGGRGRGPPVRGRPCPGVGRGDVGGGAGRPRLAAVAVLAAGPVLLLGRKGCSRDFMQSGESGLHFQFSLRCPTNLINFRPQRKQTETHGA